MSPKIIEHDGQCLTSSEWGKKVGLSPYVINARLQAGWPVADALNPAVSARQTRCFGCAYYKPLGHSSGDGGYCAYIIVTGHRRPCKAENCTVRKQEKAPKNGAERLDYEGYFGDES